MIQSFFEEKKVNTQRNSKNIIRKAIVFKILFRNYGYSEYWGIKQKLPLSINWVTFKGLWQRRIIVRVLGEIRYEYEPDVDGYDEY